MEEERMTIVVLIDAIRMRSTMKEGMIVRATDIIFELISIVFCLIDYSCREIGLLNDNQ
jgi:hypothetical protein